jgi:hypothetical protein
MKRSQFCKNLLAPGLACGCAAGLNPSGILNTLVAPANPKETPCTQQLEFTHKWVKRFFDIVDKQIDYPVRVKLMQTNGMECARGSYGELPEREPATIEEIDKNILKLQEKLGKENIYRKEDSIFLNFTGSPDGLKVSDGYCLCPMLENGPETLSPTYCQCSVGYVKYMFQSLITFKPVDVELLESLRSGGKACRFRVSV